MLNLDLLLAFRSIFVQKNIYLFLFAVGVILVIATLFGISAQYKKTNAIETTTDQINQTPLPNSQASVDAEHIFVDIGGAVANPGLYRLKSGARIADLIQASGGVLSDTSAAPWFLKNINTAKSLMDEQKVYIPFEWEVYESTQSIADLSEFPILTNSSGEKQSQEPTASKATASKETTATIAQSGTSDLKESPQNASTTTSTKINVNSATASALEELEGIGAVYAARIIQNRPYTSVEELKGKAKLSDSVISKIKDAIIF